MQLHFENRQRISGLPKPGFMSFKTTEPIAFSRRPARDALIQATLDRHVSKIFPVAELPLDVTDAYFSFGVSICGKRCLVVLCDTTHGQPLPAPDRFELALTIGRSHTLSDQLVTTSRMVWSHRQQIVSPSFEMRLAELLASATDGLSVMQLNERLTAASDKWLDSALALVCRGRANLGSITDFGQATRFYLGPNLKCD